MATPVKEIKPETPPASAAGEQKLYSMDEAAVVAHIKSYVGGDMYLSTILQTADERRDKRVIPESTLARRKEIVREIDTLVHNILADRNNKEKTHSTEDFDRFLDEHFDHPDYQFMGAKVPGINVNGWGLFMGFLNPLENGVKIGPPGQQQTKWKW